ncbi:MULTISPECIES: holo-ACP synthase [Mammaliicoccus]|uniref:Holo-[acyl-carrier-protein] synthase n=1 Tax=Mammaliicoccus vitulinus TaxID=71237 RepID=A0A2T4PTM8_9STAP|nr:MULTISPECIES: holo-ACP synthase [Mammaliicoccus]MBO3076257.1 holo-ACP synthase [Mammaliicoccus vitulinus]MEB7657055.1 holo-ACP synthase [Mammaliicoccus vitulinus]PNZ40668.1 holo-[acyl-carrier-protein] synthase [Mammaliicoccus vitulinus]PTI29656.1 holo-[acyl-carrier-protein] synthase [Mammaliicoccus vitulinus]PTI37354.1 holo-[acyl-carrier-protein] synthase [Mammaliicoccus vitulinus]
MIHGIGIDLVEIDRIRDWYVKRPTMVNKILTDDELKIFNNINLEDRKVEFVAGRFAVKEAFSKAMGSGIGKKYGFHSINCLPDENGKPEIACDGFHVHASITHTKHYAEAIVMIETEDIKQE